MPFPCLEHHEESDGWIDATVAPPRNQLDPFENHWDPLHFQCPALMWNSARQRHPGGKPGNLMVIGKSSKTVGYSDILRSRAAWNKMEYSGGTFPLVRLWFELRTMHTETLQKPLENIAFPSILEEHGAPQETWASRRSPGQIKRLIVGRFTKHSAFHVI